MGKGGCFGYWLFESSMIFVSWVEWCVFGVVGRVVDCRVECDEN